MSDSFKAKTSPTSSRPHTQWATPDTPKGRVEEGRVEERRSEEEERWVHASSPSFSGKEGQIHHCEHIDGSVSLHTEGG